MAIHLNHKQNTISTGSDAKSAGTRLKLLDDGAFTIPVGTDSDRPGTPEEGDFRYNSSSQRIEYYDGAQWVQTASAGASENLVDLNDTNISSALEDQALMYDASNNEWVNRFVQSLYDTNDNKVVGTEATSSAVNNIVFKNAASGNRAVIKTNENETDQGIEIQPNGSGQVVLSTGYSVNNDLSVATKQYVDGVASGLEVKESVKAATTSNINLSSAPTTIDNYSPSSGDRILVWQQSTASENGIYVYNGSGSAMTRASDFDEDSEVSAGSFTFVETGDTYENAGFVVTSIDPISVGTDDINWTRFSGAGNIQAGNGIAKDFNTLSAVGDKSTVFVDTNGIHVGTSSSDGSNNTNKVLFGGDASSSDVVATWEYITQVRDSSGNLGVEVSSAASSNNVDVSTTSGGATITPTATDSGVTLTPNGSGSLTLGSVDTPTSVAQGSVYVADTADTLTALTANVNGGNNQVVRWNDSNTQFEFVNETSVGGNAYGSISDGTNTANADNTSDTFQLNDGEGVAVTVANGSPDNATFDLDFSGLGSITTADNANDLVAVYDSDAGTHVNMTVSDLLGESGNPTLIESTDTYTYAKTEDVTDTLTLGAKHGANAAGVDVVHVYANDNATAGERLEFTHVNKEVQIKSADSTTDDVDIRFIPQGNGQVFVGDGGDGLIQADDSYNMTIKGGDRNSESSVGDAVIEGGDAGTATDADGGNVVLRGGTESGTGEMGDVRVYGKHYFADQSSNFSSARGGVYVLTAETTDSTQTQMNFRGSKLAVPAGETWAFNINVVARRTDGGSQEGAGYEFKGVVDNYSGTVAVVDSVSETIIGEDNTNWDVTVEANDSTDTLDIKVTGASSTTIRWVATVRTAEAA